MNHGQHSNRMVLGMLLACALPLLAVSVVPFLSRSPAIKTVTLVFGMVVLHWLFMRPRAVKKQSKESNEAHLIH